MALLDMRLVIIPLLSALIGWLTNYLAIKLLFWPYESYTVPGTNFKIQGLLSRRKKDFARAVSKIIAEEFLPQRKLAEEVNQEQMIDEVRASVDNYLDASMESRLKVFPGYFRRLFVDLISGVVSRGVESSLYENFDSLVDSVTDKIDIAKLVEQEILKLDTREIEQLSYKIAKRELQFIKALGGILGFLIGVFQISLITFIY